MEYLAVFISSPYYQLPYIINFPVSIFTRYHVMQGSNGNVNYNGDDDTFGNVNDYLNWNDSK